MNAYGVWVKKTNMWGSKMTVFFLTSYSMWVTGVWARKTNSYTAVFKTKFNKREVRMPIYSWTISKVLPMPLYCVGQKTSTFP